MPSGWSFYNWLSWNAPDSSLAPKIFARIEFWLDSCNSGTFDEIVNDTYTAATGYLGRDRVTQSAYQHHHEVYNIFLREKNHKVVRFVWEWEAGGMLQPGKLASGKTRVSDETVTYFLAGKHPHPPHPPRSTLEAYGKAPIFIPVDIME